MYNTKIQKWGNSQGLRIPKSLLDSIGLQENDNVQLIQAEDGIQIRKAAPARSSLEERLTAFYGKPVEEIGRIEGDHEYDWGEARGAEQW